MLNFVLLIYYIIKNIIKKKNNEIASAQFFHWMKEPYDPVKGFLQSQLIPMAKILSMGFSLPLEGGSHHNLFRHV